MRVHAEGRGPVELRQHDFVASGGEGALYARDGVVYKVWTDPAQAPSPERLRALKALGVARAALPRELLTDDAGAVVGFTMAHLAAHQPLARLCTRAYRERVGVDPDKAAALVADLAALVARVHLAGALVVDLSELNVLVDADHRESWLVDVASWQLPGHPATAVADHIRDRRSAGFDEGTDWFSFAVVAFQVLVGIHPYRGAHPLDLDARMRDGITVWHPDVKVPRAAVWPADAIPDRWRRWLEAVLVDGDRSAPPTGPVGAVRWTPAPLSAPVGAVERTLLLNADQPLRFAASHLGVVVAATAERVWVDGRPAAPLAGTEAAAFGPRAGTPVVAARRDGLLKLWCARTGEPIAVHLRADALTTVGGRLLVKSGEHLVEIELHELRGTAATRVVAAPRTLAEVLPHATHLFDGCALQDVLGAAWLSVFPRPGAHRALRVPELDGRRVLDARAGPGAALLVVASDNGPEAWLLRYDDAGHTDLRALPDDPASVDLCVPGTGVAILRRGATLELMRASPFDRRVRTVTDPVLDAPLRLIPLGERLGALTGLQLVALRLRAAEANSTAC